MCGKKTALDRQFGLEETPLPPRCNTSLATEATQVSSKESGSGSLWGFSFA